jgi:hypothetical protein
MKVKSFWIEGWSGVKNGCPIFDAITGRHYATFGRTEGQRTLVMLKEPIPWQTLEQQGIGFSQFEDTED